ncbi:50S ribosomal protein L18 [Candidatus Mycoplasma haematohominis]|uniref:Large ribosomal subunit protein uL18 n=1 Tax=Candidatus Mycoplasma haematohominis TaxID=1494318 RepID=A0A478FR00_9MOLU|nr:50S ribosomal protein L18 [Candidatus Mycoplasma haemohominis]
MKKVNQNNKALRDARHKRILSRVREGNDRIRVRVTKTNSHVYIQAIKDLEQKTIASSSSLSLKLKNGNKESCVKLAKDLSQKLKKLKVENLVIDRGGHSYTGRISIITGILREEGFKV